MGRGSLRVPRPASALPAATAGVAVGHLRGAPVPALPAATAGVAVGHLRGAPVPVVAGGLASVTDACEVRGFEFQTSADEPERPREDEAHLGTFWHQRCGLGHAVRELVAAVRAEGERLLASAVDRYVDAKHAVWAEVERIRALVRDGRPGGGGRAVGRARAVRPSRYEQPVGPDGVGDPELRAAGLEPVRDRLQEAWRKFAYRAQESLYRWGFSEDGGVSEFVQSDPNTFRPTPIPIEKCLLFRTTSARGSPEGRSLRALFDAVERIVRDLRRDEQVGIIFPKEVDEAGRDMWELKLLTTGGQRQIDTDPVIARYDQRIAMSVLDDFILLGHEKVGSKALGVSKVELFGKALTRSWTRSRGS